MQKTPNSDQLNEFIKAAREHGADVPEEEFDRALRKVAKAPPAPMQKAEAEKGEAAKPPPPPHGSKEPLKNSAENRRKGVKVGR